MQEVFRRSHAIPDAVDVRECVAGMLRAANRNFEQLLAAAAIEWDLRFAGNDPADACVTVRIQKRTRLTHHAAS